MDYQNNDPSFRAKYDPIGEMPNIKYFDIDLQLKESQEKIQANFKEFFNQYNKRIEDLNKVDETNNEQIKHIFASNETNKVEGNNQP